MLEPCHPDTPEMQPSIHIHRLTIQLRYYKGSGSKVLNWRIMKGVSEEAIHILWSEVGVVRNSQG